MTEFWGKLTLVKALML